MFVFANAWLNRLKKPVRNWNFCSPWTWKFLKRVKSWFMRVGVRMLYGGTEIAVLPERGHPDAVEVEDLLAHIVLPGRGSHGNSTGCRAPTTLRIAGPTTSAVPK